MKYLELSASIAVEFDRSRPLRRARVCGMSVAIDQGAGCPGDIIKGQGGCYSLARTRRNPVSRVRKRRLGDRPP